MKNLNNKGFTLVEILVTMVILGTITTMAIPVLRNITQKKETSRHQVYTNSLLESSRLYNDAYSEDLFGDESFGCREITYEEMATKFLIKDIDNADETCNNKNTYVRIIKINDKYNFSASLTCTDKAGNEVYSENNIKTSIDCSRNESVGPNVSFITPVMKDKKKNKTKDKEITVIINSKYGIKENSKIYYNFSKTPDDLNLVNDWKEYKLSTKIEEKVNWTKSFKLDTKNIPTGEYYLVIKTTDEYNKNTLIDAAGNKSPKEIYVSDQILVDKEGPLLGNSTVEYLDAEKTKVKYVLKDAHDNVNGIAIKVCLSENDSCSEFKKYDEAILKIKHRTKAINVFLKDLSGNITKNQIILK